MNATTSTTVGGTGGGVKVSFFAAKSKSGFVIPKNKLSGSLVPVFRGAKKAPGANDGEAITTTADHVQRKTKWGSDLTQDTSVRQTRALAYQTRVDQINQQLQTERLQLESKLESLVADQSADSESSSPSIDTKTLALLELEKRELIVEILKLNPSYKAPPDYKPLLKEASIPIPIKEFPGYNFMGLIFGPGNDAKKQLEKETGARIQVLGTKSKTGEKVDISPSDRKESLVAYEELSVHVSAETFEKVDAAVALIELLVTSVLGNVSTGDNANFLDQSHQTLPFVVSSAVNQEVVQPVVEPPHTPQQGHFQYQNPWFPATTPQTPANIASGFISLKSSSSPLLNNHVHVHSPFHPSTPSSFFRPLPVSASVFNTNFQNPSLFPTRPQPQVQSFSNPYAQSNFPNPSPQPSFVQASISSSLPSPSGQTWPPHIGPPGPPSERSMIPAGSVSGWSGAPSVPAHIGTGMEPMIPTPGPQAIVPRPGFLSSTPPSNATASTFPSGPSTLQSSNVFGNLPNASTNFTSVLPPHAGPSSTPSLIQLPPLGAPLPNSSQQGLQAGVGHVTNFNPIRSSMASSKLQHSGIRDFTFQPPYPSHQPLLRLSNQPTDQSPPLPRHAMQSPGPQAQSFRLPVSNSIPQPGLHTFPRPQAGNQMGQVHAHPPFLGDPTSMSSAHRVPVFSNARPVPPSVMHMGSRNFNQLPNLAGHLQPRPGNPAAMALRGQFGIPNQPFNNHLSFASGRPVPVQGGHHQNYDPFSPSAASIASQQLGGNRGKAQKQENDPEYEDLMASVGVR